MNGNRVIAMRASRIGVLCLFAVGACVPAAQPGSVVTPLSGRLTDEVIARDMSRFDSLGVHYAGNRRATALIGLARQAYERNDDGVLTEQLIARAKSAAEGTGAMAGTRRVDLWNVLDSASRAPTRTERVDRIVDLEVALLKSQFEVLGAPRCAEWEGEAIRIVAQLRVPPSVVVAVTPAPTPAPVVETPKPAPAPEVKRAPAPMAKVPSMVHFALDKSNLSPRTREVLDAMVRVIDTIPGLTITLEGNTDPRASVAYNEALSKRRAESVRKYLVSKGIAPGRISMRALGKSQLETQATDVRSMAVNRRVLLRYYSKDGVEIPTVELLDDLQLERVPTAKPKR